MNYWVVLSSLFELLINKITKMKANDFRIGNIVDLYGTIATIQAVDFSTGFAIEKGKPIELNSKNILRIKNSFVAAENSNKICITAPYGFELHFDKYGNDYVLSVYCNTGVFVPQECKYFHQIQNLWFSIFSEELVFSSTEP